MHSSRHHWWTVPLSQLQFSEVLVKWRRFFSFLAAQQGKSDMMVLEQKLELEQLKVCVTASESHSSVGVQFLVSTMN